MAKRGATSDLNDRNWDDEDEPEEAGVFVKADREVLAGRVIRKAKRRGAGDGEGGAKVSAFGGFGGLTGPSSGLKPSTPSGGLTFPSLTPGGNSAFASFGSSVNGTAKAKESAAKEETGKGGWKDSPAYFSFLKALNHSVLAWVKQHVEENPYIILTPVFKDYEKYLASKEAEHTSSKPSTISAKLDSQSPKSDTKNGDHAKPSMLGASALTSIEEDKPSSQETKTKISEAPKAKTFGTTAFGGTGFTFGSTTTSTAAAATSPTTSPTGSKPGLTFGTSTTPASTGFNFGKSSTAASATTTAPSGFSFSNSASLASGKTGFSFGTSTTSATTAGTTGFSFGTSASSAATTGTTGFSFGTSTTSATTTGTTGFSFGAPSSTGAGATSGFSFAGAASQAAANAGASKDNEDEEYVPPKPEVKEIKEADAIYSKRCKLYYQRKDQWVDRGVGNIHLKPVEESKTQILIRADTNLGNILLNVILSAGMPVSRQGKNNVFLACVPNPPLKEGETEQAPVPMLIRVKTGEDADELFSHIEKRKELLS